MQIVSLDVVCQMEGPHSVCSKAMQVVHCCGSVPGPLLITLNSPAVVLGNCAAMFDCSHIPLRWVCCAGAS
jgi:hypothetical protein